MEHFITSFSYVNTPFTLHGENQLTVRFSLKDVGETLINFTSSVPDGDWGMKDKESAVVTVLLNGEYNQDYILFYGNEPFTYERMIGSLPPGEHELSFVFQSNKSSKLIIEAIVHMIEIRQVKESDYEIVFYQHAPVIYGRHLMSPFENSYTDTPLVLFYYSDHTEDGAMIIEYHIIFSHEDGGTTATKLMSKWGRTSDIEWVYKVKVDPRGRRLLNEDETEFFQGAEHITTPFKGARGLGNHPILQVATDNGNFSDQISSTYRYFLKPATCLPRQLNRETVMDKYQWTYLISAKEIRRQERLELSHDPNTPLLSDPRHYLYIQSTKLTVEGKDAQGKVDFKVKLLNKETLFSATHQNFEMAYDADGPFSTTVKLPKGTKISDIEKIYVSYIKEICAESNYSIRVNGIFKSFFLGGGDMPSRPFIFSDKEVEVSLLYPQQIIWKRDD
ncbi:hypothetical protein CR203_23040 [Salipaludibacillus neizhouensis]|uniref:Uncharacterized protein n=1 Tax=Salipaludibacillus neizhouensis TaxID=885475 RepID=A0A3A9K3Y8_9BACI|nr:hypothetical protein [Salipaludibacillus neizhouensis]RKL65011.1 hypothetical protein CR203_23040 [Salipaludibacillus neizhouensis]